MHGTQNAYRLAGLLRSYLCFDVVMCFISPRSAEHHTTFDLVSFDIPHQCPHLVSSLTLIKDLMKHLNTFKKKHKFILLDLAKLILKFRFEIHIAILVNNESHRQCDLCLHSNRPPLTKHCMCHVTPGKKTHSHGKIAYTFELAAKTQRFCPAVCAQTMLWFSSDVRGHILNL